MTKIKDDVLIRLDALKQAGLKPKQIADQLKLNYETVKKNFYRTKLVEGLPPKVRVKKGYFTGRIPGLIRRYLEQNPMATLDQIIFGCKLETSKASLCRYLNTNGLPRTQAKRNILLREVNREKRLAFAKLMVQKTDQELRLILWSDETMVKAWPNGELVFYRALQERPDIVSPRVQQGGAGQMLWGCLSIDAYGPLEAIEGHMNAARYLELLKNVVKPELDAARDVGRVLVFQQDNAKPHTNPAVKDYLENWGYEVIDWPPQSPDLSPIENFWHIMKMKMKALVPRPRTKATMRNAMMEIWDNLDEDLLEKIVGSFRARLEACIKNNGGLVKFK